MYFNSPQVIYTKNVYQVSPDLHPHLGLNLKRLEEKEHDTNQQAQSSSSVVVPSSTKRAKVVVSHLHSPGQLQLRGITDRAKKEMEAKHKAANTIRSQNMKTNTTISRLSTKQKEEMTYLGLAERKNGFDKLKNSKSDALLVPVANSETGRTSSRMRGAMAAASPPKYPQKLGQKKQQQQQQKELPQMKFTTSRNASPENRKAKRTEKNRKDTEVKPESPENKKAKNLEPLVYFGPQPKPDMHQQNKKCVELMNNVRKISYFSSGGALNKSKSGSNQGSQNDLGGGDDTWMGLNNYILQGKVLGSGAFAIVRTAIQSTTGKHVAIKTYDKLRIIDEVTLNGIDRECKLMSEVQHEHVVRFIEKIESTRHIHVVMEYGGKFNLKDFVSSGKDGTGVKASDVRQLFERITKGLQAIHSKNIIHRDLKLENIVLSHIETPKIVDFGFAREASASMGVCGTLNYMSPELVKKNPDTKQSEKSDIWALGVIFYFVLTKRMPFVGKLESELKKSIQESEADFKGLDPAEQAFLSPFFRKDPLLRPSCSSILSHPYLQAQAPPTIPTA